MTSSQARALSAGSLFKAYARGSHTALHHRHHILWAPKYRFKEVDGEDRMRVREIVRQVCNELPVAIIHSALTCDHVHMFVETPPHIIVSDFVRKAKGRSPL
ncbi:IS200/IS605 family transposase [Parasphingorhabdus halotolerans]|uniref:IS200/IS605 family transposase n=1 Tax=Parasphingorhabdus halotolerans TaxID=2725558 RepID=UPI001FEC864D|nr:IS200/IS605 family transposase [Parasphingorhabdus halotolerans]